MNFDLRHVPFSRYGSYFVLSRMGRAPGRAAGLYLRTVHGDARTQGIFRVELLAGGKRLPVTEIASPGRLRLQA
ncbi:unnamed protein product, partial [marine sediment metagenome]